MLDEKERFRKWFQGLSVFWKAALVFGIFYLLRWAIEGIPIDGRAVITTLIWSVLISVIASLIKMLRKRDNGQNTDDGE